MKKILTLIILLLSILVVTGCEQKRKLYVLNVGDYIDESLVEAFEEEFDCIVVYTELNSNEEIYQKLKNESYDICIVSDYMIDRMMQENLIQELDYSKIPNYEYSKLFIEAQQMINEQCTAYKNYFLPYFWGTVGILYNTEVDDKLEDYIKTNGLKVIFENNEYNKGMYNSARDCLCMALMVLGYDLNTSNVEELREAMNLVKSVTYRAWGDDNLKEMIHNGMLDMALVYSGDYLDERYQCSIDDEEINFNYYAPEKTNIWFDGMVLTNTCKNNDLAYEFLNFFSDKDNQAQNADYIGYCPLSEEVMDILYTEYIEDYEDIERDFLFPYGNQRKVYKFVSVDHYNYLNDFLDESKSK